MAIRGAILAILFVVSVLSPLAQILRTQNPWKCFPLTQDESFYLQAFYHWFHGGGYRRYDGLAYDPSVSVGVPMAWGTAFLHEVLRIDWPQAARLGVHLSFIGLVLWTSIWTGRRYKSWASGILCGGILALCIASFPLGPYLTYGILGEIPGAVFAWAAFLALDLRFSFLSGPIGVFAFIVKPSYAFVAPAATLAAFLKGKKQGIASALASAVLGIGYLAHVAHSREQTILEYVARFSEVSAGDSPRVPLAQTMGFFASTGWVSIVVSILALYWSLRIVLSFWRRKNPSVPGSELGMSLFFLSGVFYYVALARLPQPKHWFVFFVIGACLVAIRLGDRVGRFVSRFVSDRDLALVAGAACLTWLLNIPGSQIRTFKQKSELACDVKEQRKIDRFLRGLSDKGALRPGDLIEVGAISSSSFLYELGWNPPYFSSWSHVPSPRPRWITGDRASLNPWPNGCQARVAGEYAVLLECDSER